MTAPHRLLLATTNGGKVREIRQALEGAGVQIVTLADWKRLRESFSPPEETGVTFAENARLKADYYAARTGLLTVAENSGLCIDALGGRPGVESARYPGDTYPDKFRHLYRELAGHPRPWTARYVCAVAVVGGQPRRLLRAVEATVEGEISPTPRGANGFGYDPVFFYPPYKATLGEVDDARKLAVSHRGQAFRALREWLTRNDRRGRQ